MCFALDALGIGEDDPRARAVTQTGGLPYHGGPGSNYMTHSLAAMTETLRDDPGSYGVVSGVGMHMQKHAYGVWSTDAGCGRRGTDPAPYVADGGAGGDRRLAHGRRHRRHVLGAARARRGARAGAADLRPAREAAAATPSSTAVPRRWRGPRTTS